MRPWIGVLLACGTLAGCSNQNESKIVTRSPAIVASLQSRPAGAVVAKVNGRPIYEKCVAEQPALEQSPEASRKTAVQHCIDFELLAQAAENNQLQNSPDSIFAQKKEAVRALIEQDLYQKYASPDDIPQADIEKFWPKFRFRYNHPEIRFVYYCRAAVGKKEPKGGETDLAAQSLAQEVHRATFGKKWDGPSFVKTCMDVAGSRVLEVQRDSLPIERNKFDKTFVDAAYSVTEMGSVAPLIRTKWGWDVILVADVEFERTTTFEQALPELREKFFRSELFTEYRNSLFLRWAKSFATGVNVEVFPDLLADDDSLAVTPHAGAPAMPATPATPGTAAPAPGQPPPTASKTGG